MSDDRDSDTPETKDTSETQEPAATEDNAPKTDDNLVHFNPWRDASQTRRQVDVFGDEPDVEQIATFMSVVFDYCEGLIPVRSFIDKGQGFDGRPHNIWVAADEGVAEKMGTFARWAWREGAAVYVIPGTVAEQGKARAEDVVAMQTIVVDIDSGDVKAKLAHLRRHLGPPTMLVESGGVTTEGQQKCHVWWKLSEPAKGVDIRRVCRLRGEIAAKAGGDMHFRSAHQPIRVAGSVYYKNNLKTLVQIVEVDPYHRVDLEEFAEAVQDMPPAPGVSLEPSFVREDKPKVDDVLTSPVHAGGADSWSRFEGASAAIGHFVRMVHEGRMTKDEGWEGICQYNAAMLRPAWSVERLQRESERIWALHVERNGPPLVRATAGPPAPLRIDAFTLGALLDDTSPMPADLIAPRVLTPGGLLVLGGAPKVGKSDFLISWLVHMAAGVPFLGFTPPRPLRIFYLQAEIQYHYLRERLQGIGLDPEVLAAARDTFVATPKLKLLLDEGGVGAVAEAVAQHFPDTPVDILCIDPIRNVFDGGPEGGGENDNDAMMFFLRERVEPLREVVNPDAGVILAHHTKKVAKTQVKEDPFLALSGASSLRGFYTSGIIMHRPDEERTERRLEIELRNGPALPPMTVDKRGGRWVEIRQQGERLVRAEYGAQLDAERLRKRDAILELLLSEAAEGRMYSAYQFAETFENKAGLGGLSTIRERLSVLATKGYVKFVKDDAAKDLGLDSARLKFGFLCVEGMVLGPLGEAVDEETGEIVRMGRPVLPSHYKCSQTGAALPVENPSVWVYREEDPE